MACEGHRALCSERQKALTAEVRAFGAQMRIQHTEACGSRVGGGALGSHVLGPLFGEEGRRVSHLENQREILRDPNLEVEEELKLLSEFRCGLLATLWDSVPQTKGLNCLMGVRVQ